MHLPKTAGESVRQVALRQYPKSEIYRVRGRSDTADVVHSSRTARTRLVTGHLHFVTGTRFGNPEWAVVIRDPVARVVSLYRWLSDKGHLLTEAGLEHFVRARAEYSDLDNGQVRIMSGRSDVAKIPPESLIDEADYQRAAHNLACCTTVGDFDDLEGYVDRLTVRYGWVRDTVLPVTHKSHSPAELTGELAEEIAALNQWDAALYGLAQQLAQEDR